MSCHLKARTRAEVASGPKTVT